MFERFTEKARRVIFFARLEASEYGSRQIDSEHILLGLFTEAPALLDRALGPNANEKHIRQEVEKVIERGERFSTAIEVTLTDESKKILKLAVVEADGLGNQSVCLAHLLLALLSLRRSRAAGILKARGVNLKSLGDLIASDKANFQEE